MENLEKIYSEHKNIEPNFGFNGLGLFVFERTYRRLKEDNTYETWNDTIYRVVSNVYKYVTDEQFSKINEKPSQMFNYIFDMKILPSGRSLWSMDKKIIDKTGSIALNSCCFLSFNEDETPENVFSFLCNTLMLGCGCSFDTFIYNNEYMIYKPLKDFDMLVIPDSREIKMIKSF